MKVARADVWKGRWIVVQLDGGRFDRAFMAPTIRAAVDDLRDAVVIGVDMPIGLPLPGQRRPADDEARTFVGRRWQSVFLTPSADLLEAPTHRQANESARAEGRAGVSAQAYALRRLVFEVQPVAEQDDRIREVHPEVSFAVANGGPLRWPKSCWNGMVLRRQLLEAEGIAIPDDLGSAGAAGVADVLDAAIVAWSADRIAGGRAQSLPASSGRIGAIWR